VSVDAGLLLLPRSDNEPVESDGFRFGGIACSRFASARGRELPLAERSGRLADPKAAAVEFIREPAVRSFAPNDNGTRAGRAPPHNDVGGAVPRGRRTQSCVIGAERKRPLRAWYAGISMRRTTVKLPDDLDARLRHEAQRRGTTIAEVTRRALEAELGAGPRRRLGAAATGHSGQGDISERVEEIIAAEISRSR
jgi:hypothetical protein